MSALGSVREVYGVRKLFFDERERVVKVEYDASRLVESDIAALLRGAGLDIAPIRASASWPASTGNGSNDNAVIHKIRALAA